MTDQWDGRASAEGWWWVRDRYGDQFPAQWRMDLWWSAYWEMPRDPAQLLRNDYTLLGRCEPPGEAYARGWKACQEAAASIADKVSKKNDTGSGFDSQPAYVAAASIARAIRSLTPPKDEP